MTCELERIRKEAVLVLSGYYPGTSLERLKKPTQKTGQLVPRPIFEPKTTRTEVQSSITRPACSVCSFKDSQEYNTSKQKALVITAQTQLPQKLSLIRINFERMGMPRNQSMKKLNGGFNSNSPVMHTLTRMWPYVRKCRSAIMTSAQATVSRFHPA
jgi:hypothetical protein